MDTIEVGGTTLRFLKDRHETGGSLDAFEMTIRPNAKMPVPRFHETWDETVYGLSGTTTWQIDGTDTPIGPGQSEFIRRGTVHGFRNDGTGPATCLCILTPGALGPEYFREMADLASGGKPDLERMKAVMLRYGLVPAPND